MVIDPEPYPIIDILSDSHVHYLLYQNQTCDRFYSMPRYLPTSARKQRDYTTIECTYKTLSNRTLYLSLPLYQHYIHEVCLILWICIL